MEKINSIELGNKIRELRESKGETQDDLKKVLNFSTRQQVSYIEQGNRLPTLEHIRLLSKHFNVSTDYLLGISKAATTDTSVKAICDYTGLDEQLVYELNYCNSNSSIDKVYILSESKQAFNRDFCNALFSTLLDTYSVHNDFFELKERISTLIENYLKINSDYEALQGQSNKKDIKALDFTTVEALEKDCCDIEQSINSCLFGLQQNMIEYVNEFFADYFENEIEKTKIEAERMQDIINEIHLILIEISSFNSN